MPLTIADESLNDLRMDETEARAEIACRLFDAGKLTLWPAAKLAGLSRPEMEGELRKRNIAIYRPSLADFADDMLAVEEMEREDQAYPSS